MLRARGDRAGDAHSGPPEAVTRYTARSDEPRRRERVEHGNAAAGGRTLDDVPRWSRTAAHMRTPRAHSDGVRAFPQQLLDHPTFVARLSWRGGSRVPIHTVEVARSISEATDAVFFCDNSVFHDRLDNAILSALLDAQDRMVLTPLVLKELHPWLKARPTHAMTEAIQNNELRPGARPIPEMGQAGRAAFDYYVGLLLLRRHALAASEARFIDENGRPPDDADRAQLRETAQKDLGPRGFLLAAKGASEVPTDESLVYLAAEHALRTGRPTVILTGDADVEEQFFKLLWLIDTHYRAMLLADRYVLDFAAYGPRQLPRKFAASPQCPFHDDGAILIERGPADLLHVLPAQFRFVAIECWTVGDYFSKMAFGAEQEMARVLDTKDRTGGLSTDRLGGRNLHAWLAPLSLPKPDRGCAVVARDKRFDLPGSDASVAQLDVAHTLANIEHHTGLQGVPVGRVVVRSPKGTPVVYHSNSA